MLDRVSADEVMRRANAGRTRPILMRCAADSDTPIELFCKLSAGCDEGVTSLAREIVAACLARDLGLPVPVPYLVDIPPELAQVVIDEETAQQLRESSNTAFGSAKVDNQFSNWSLGSRISETMLPAALGTLLFDAVIENVDRRIRNPNCLVAGNRIRIIDHELAFPLSTTIIGWRPPWHSGSLAWLDQPDGHIFCQGLKKRHLDFSPLLRV